MFSVLTLTGQVWEEQYAFVEAVGQQTVSQLLQNSYTDAKRERGVSQKQSVPQVEDLVQGEHICGGNGTKKMTYCEYILQPLHCNSCALMWSTDLLYHSCCYIVCFCNSRLCIFRFQNRNYPCLQKKTLYVLTLLKNFYI